MSDDVLERLRRENPVPERMPALPIEPVLARLDNEPPTAGERSSTGPRGARRAIRTLPAIASLAVVLAVGAVGLTVGDHGRSSSPTISAVSPPATLRTNPLPPRPAASAHINLFQLARDNVRDTPTKLFENNPEVAGATLAALWHQTVIASTVRRIKTFTVPGVGPIQYWVANTKQQGICTALRLPDGEWAGLQHDGRVAGSMPGCRPTRAQLGRGALILDGFDYEQTTVTGSTGQSWTIQYGAVSVPNATQVRETVNGITTPVIDGEYFAIALRGGPAIDWGDTGRLEALNSSGQRVAEEGEPLPGTPTTKCIGRYDVRRERIPHTHRTALLWQCRRYVKVLAK
jgi:hypothetical protein